MWTCSKCGREFKNLNQNHFCGKADSIDVYIEEQSDEVKPILNRVREIIREAAPEAQEKISWQMPTFWQGENLIHFCAQKKHLGIYPGALENLPEEILNRLEGYKTTKGAIQFPYNKPIDYELITEITKARIESVVTKGSG